MKNRKGQIAPTTVITIIIAVVVLVAIILFFTGRFQTGSQQVSQLTPSELGAASTTCRIACESANAGAQAKTTLDCNLWKANWCRKEVVVGGIAKLCRLEDWGTATNPLGNEFCKFAYDSTGCTCS